MVDIHPYEREKKENRKDVRMHVCVVGAVKTRPKIQ